MTPQITYLPWFYDAAAHVCVINIYARAAQRVSGQFNSLASLHIRGFVIRPFIYSDFTLNSPLHFPIPPGTLLETARQRVKIISRIQRKPRREKKQKKDIKGRGKGAQERGFCSFHWGTKREGEICVTRGKRLSMRIESRARDAPRRRLCAHTHTYMRGGAIYRAQRQERVATALWTLQKIDFGPLCASDHIHTQIYVHMHIRVHVYVRTGGKGGRVSICRLQIVSSIPLSPTLSHSLCTAGRWSVKKEVKGEITGRSIRELSLSLCLSPRGIISFRLGFTSRTPWKISTRMCGHISAAAWRRRISFSVDIGAGTKRGEAYSISGRVISAV